MRSFRKALILLLSGFAAGCDKPHDAGVVNEQPEKNTVKQQNVTVTVFAAASLTESLTMLGNKFQEKHPGIRILFNFDSSGTLKRQIEEGAVSDIFISMLEEYKPVPFSKKLKTFISNIRSIKQT